VKRNWIIFLLILFAGTGQLAGQGQKWTLGDCISYALSNNITLKRQELTTETYRADLAKAKMNMLPSLNIGSDARVGFGRSIDPVTNLITFKQNLSNSYAVSTSVELFNGFTTLNTISAGKFMLKAGIETEKVTRNTLILSIMSQFYQVLYSKGLENASRMQLDLSERQLYRIEKMVETGKEAVSRKFEMESQVSTDRLSYTVAMNNSSQALTTLKQMLQFDASQKFDVVMPDLEGKVLTDMSVNTDSIYNIAARVLPRLKAIEYELRANEKQVAVAKGFIAPRITIGGTVYTGFYKVISEDAGEQISFNDQLKNNNSQAIFFSLNIPLFNNYTTARNIKLARLRESDTRLKLELERYNLYSEIENACLDFSRGRDEFLAAEANLAFNRKSFYTVEKKFESGLVDVTDYAAAKATLFTAETEMLRTRLQLMIRQLMISFYTTGEYENIINN
jgi:outer membrane protein